MEVSLELSHWQCDEEQDPETPAASLIVISLLSGLAWKSNGTWVCTLCCSQIHVRYLGLPRERCIQIFCGWFFNSETRCVWTLTFCFALTDYLALLSRVLCCSTRRRRVGQFKRSHPELTQVRVKGKSPSDGPGSAVIVITSLLVHHVGWAWHTVARCEKHKSFAHMQEYVTVPSQNTCHFRFRRSHNLRMRIMTHAACRTLHRSGVGDSSSGSRLPV